MIELPFTEDQFLEVFRQYNESFGYGAAALWIVTAIAAIVSFRVGRSKDKWLAFLLAVHWFWAGSLYHFMHFARINPTAYVFGALFLFQGLFLIYFGLWRARLHFAVSVHCWGWFGLALVLYSLAYPFLGLIAGFEYPRLATFGVPCPVTLLTAGFLLMTQPPAPRSVLIIPILWSVIGGSAAFLFSVYPDWTLFVAGSLLILHVILRPADNESHIA